MEFASNQSAISLPRSQSQNRYTMARSTTSLASSGVHAVAWTPALGSKHTTPPRKELGQRPVLNRLDEDGYALPSCKEQLPTPLDLSTVVLRSLALGHAAHQELQLFRRKRPVLPARSASAG